MRNLLSVAMLIAACAVAAPAAAQVYVQPGMPIPGPQGPQVQYPQPPQAPGPVYVNQQAGPPMGTTYGPPQQGGWVSANPPSFNGPQQGPPQNGRVWQNGRWVSLPAPGPVGPGNGNRWGGNINGRWWGGMQAPGGWGAYRRPRRGGSLPNYWMQPGFQIPDYLSFGLSAPPYGYYWVRYYDDAVLVDARGGIQHSVSGIAWSGASASAYANGGYASSAASASAYGGTRPIQSVDPDTYYAPQGGYPPPVAYGPPAVQGYGPPPPQVYVQQGGYGQQGYVQQGGYAQQGYYQQGGGYYYGGGSTTTTVVIQSAPVVTTTIIEEELIEEVTTTTSYVRPTTVRRPARRHPPRARPVRRQCGCQCVCR